MRTSNAGQLLLTGIASDDPDANEIRLRNPRLPAFLDEVSLHDLRLGTSSVDLVLSRHDDDVALRVLRKEGSIRVSAVYS